MKLTSLLNYLAQKLLYLWINTDVTRVGELSADNKNIIVYVMASRSWTDLLVLEQECKSLDFKTPLSHINDERLKTWHSVYTIAPAQPLKDWLQQKTKHSKMLCALHQALLEYPDIDIHFIPVTIFWGRPVLKQKHWLRVLFSETWGFAGRTRRFFTILFNGKNTLVQLSSTISFRDVLSNADKDSDSIDEIQGLLSRRLIEIKSATLGPDISHRRVLVRQLLENKTIKKAIQQRQEKDNITQYQATKIADNYLNEIVADRSYITIQIFQRVLTAFWNKFYSGIDVHFSDQLKQLALDHELVYVPCHRSHIDYLLLSYVIHKEGLAIPYIAAGRNLNMPVIGSLLRKGGAFFIRRSFRDNPLYSTVMFEYLASQLAMGMPIEYFVEGGRSRTGRLLQPKPGMLAMTIRAFLKYPNRPIAFIPVYIGYEKMIEGKAYLAELKGDDKKSETLLGSIRSFFKIRGFYGRVTTNFGQPVFLRDILNANAPEWSTQPYDDENRPAWLRPTVAQTAQQVMQNINACCDVNAVNLVATALLAAQNQTMDEGELIRNLSFYVKLTTRINYSTSVTQTTREPLEQIHHAEALGLVHRKKHAMGDFIYLDESHAILLTYYRNNTLHLFVMPSLIACCFTNAHTLDRETIYQYIKIIYPFIKAEFFLPWPASKIEKVIDNLLSELSASKHLDTSKTDTFIRPPLSTEQHAQLTSLAQIISPVLELYYMIFALLAESGSNTLSRERLDKLCYLMAQRLSLMYENNSPDFFDKRLIANFINSLIDFNYVTVNDTDKLDISEEAIIKGRQARRLLNKNMQYNILQMLRTSKQEKLTNHNEHD
ncbi:MAG: glycerol-3-phosphate 1-O-acyltransferase PlsB [Gammaproteobacteria bacterium]|nr:glycerol-3-phosphate 1-O-acyltransferase PlsB [Gammaproteobacteria bacterium]